MIRGGKSLVNRKKVTRSNHAARALSVRKRKTMNNETSLTDFRISGAFHSLSGGHLRVTTDHDNGDLPIGDGRIDASFTAGCVQRVDGYDASGRQCFTWEVPEGVALFFSKNPNGSLKLATASRQ
jgi:hypothetical protein